MNNPNKIIVHHTAAIEPVPQFEAINQWHKDRDFPISELGWYIGYHYVIEKDGMLRTARREHEIGAHTIGQNEQSIGICLVGNFNIEVPTRQQIATLGDMLTSLCIRYRLDEYDIFPHRAFAQKDCFGTKLNNHWASRVYLEHEYKRIQLRLDVLPAD